MSVSIVDERVITSRAMDLIMANDAEIQRLERELAEAQDEIERLRWQLGQRGARMQIMREAFRETDWLQFVSYDHPEAADWFDADGVPK